MDASESVKILKALGEETRIRIFEMLRGGKLCACKILEKFNITQPTLSHHMKLLCDCGIVVAEKDWKWTYYSLNCAKLDEFLAYLGDTKCHAEITCKCKNNCE
ncbi:MAG: ArsR/SmtB family transcription factor [Candidatus Coproplasma sp.]